jgi:anti-sigma factor RsiW
VSQACAAVIAQIVAYLSGELPEAECAAIDAHAEACRSCASLVAGLRETLGLCRQAAGMPLPDHIRARALERVRKLLDS